MQQYSNFLANFCIQFKLWTEVDFFCSKIFFRTFEPLKCIANHWCVTGYLKLSFSFEAIYYSFFGSYYPKHWIQRESDAVLKVFMLEAMRSWIFLLFAFVVCG